MSVAYLVRWGRTARLPLLLLDKRICIWGVSLPLALPPNTFAFPILQALCQHKERTDPHDDTNRQARSSCDSNLSVLLGLHRKERQSFEENSRLPARSPTMSGCSIFLSTGWILNLPTLVWFIYHFGMSVASLVQSLL